METEFNHRYSLPTRDDSFDSVDNYQSISTVEWSSCHADIGCVTVEDRGAHEFDAALESLADPIFRQIR